MRNTLFALIALVATPAFAQVTPPPMESVTLDQAVERALQNNPTVGQAAQGVVLAEALLQQARAATLPKAFATFNGLQNSTERRFDDVITSPRTQGTFAANLAMPVLAASRWAARTQARDQVAIANLSTADVRTDIAVSTAQAYLAIIGFRRQVDVSIRALESSRAHFDYAHRRLEAGAGTRLNELRAGQEVASNEARLEITQLAVRRAQEALGVLMAASGPVDAAEDPVFDIPTIIDESGWMSLRPDLQLFAAEARAADRVWRDSSKDWFPTAIAAFDPQALVPASIFTSSRSWRFSVLFSQPLFDSGERRAIKRQREADLNVSRLALTGLEIQARSEVRVAQDNVRTNERALVHLRSAATQAQEVLNITTFAFEAGATTNLEVIDAQRQARDADSEAAIAENAFRRAQLELLAALGRFPR
ncbi:MAG: TolC family protein [Acidobacteria bacterium]|nr:MAG: TolC family protein [Acidobacteriota bacterium]